MTELYDEDNTKKLIEVVPEMLDYEFVANCDSPDELLAILKMLKSGEHGRYPNLEQTVRTKVGDLLSKEEQRKILAAKPSIIESTREKESLHDWLCGDHSLHKSGQQKSLVTRNVRIVTQANLSKNETTPIEKCARQEVGADSKQFFRKEKLSTKVRRLSVPNIFHNSCFLSPPRYHLFSIRSTSIGGKSMMLTRL